jgi:plasmid stabilization system protein ParE
VPEPQSYALRFQERALRDIDAAYVRLAELSSADIADRWLDELRDTIATLAETPRRFPIAPERFSREIRQILFRRSGSRITHRIMFTITGEGNDASDSPTVTILHVRHGAAKPLTRPETRQLENLE